ESWCTRSGPALRPGARDHHLRRHPPAPRLIDPEHQPTTSRPPARPPADQGATPMTDSTFLSAEAAFADQQERLRDLRHRAAPPARRTPSPGRRAVARRLRGIADALEG